jgi:bacillithiol synthase
MITGILKTANILSSPNFMQPDKHVLAGIEVTRLPYQQTGFFSKIVADYLNQHDQLHPFYQYEVSIEGVKKAMEDRKKYSYNRKVLVSALKLQYKGLNTSAEFQQNLERLLQENTFTITTAHQPNIFTGPLYFIYKILHAIKISEVLKERIPDNNFVPVFFMGSEDADLDELGHFNVDGKRYEWKTKQTGAVGRMKVDKEFIGLINELSAQLGVLPFGDEIISMFQDCYKVGDTIQQSTLRLVNTLFGEYGLVVLIPDNASLKKVFQPVVKKELQQQFSHKAVEETISSLNKHYKVQAGGRDLNFFYLLDDKRERIEFSGSKYLIRNLQLEFTEDEIIKEVEEHPQRFSPNVILRGVFQEIILPNIVFIGGGGEIAYWLELKKVFEEAEVPYPMLVLRNSFLILKREQQELMNDLGFNINDFFKPSELLLDQLTKRESLSQLSLSEEIGELNSFYQQLHEITLKIDASLAEHVNALQAKALKRINELEKKMLRSEKRKFESAKRKIAKLKDATFPNGSLQERVENISGVYGREGKVLIEYLYKQSLSLEQQFTVITI